MNLLYLDTARWGLRGSLLLWGAAACGILSLPSKACDPIWLAALAMPAVLLWALAKLGHPGPTLRLLLVGALQISGIALAVQVARPIDPPAGLACSLLPPLTYTLCRRQSSDAVLALFLSFCLLLVGGMLSQGSGGHRLLGAHHAEILQGSFFALALPALWLDASKSARRGQPKTPGSAAAAQRPRQKTLIQSTLLALGIAGLAAITTATSFEALTLMEGKPGKPRASSRPGDDGRQSRVGLSSEFNLDGGGNPVLDAGAAPIALAQPIDPDSLPEDLYLRSRAFEQAGIEAWVDLPTRGRERSRAWRMRRISPGLKRIRLVRLGIQKGEVLIPTGATDLRTDMVVTGTPGDRVLWEQDPIGDLVIQARFGSMDGYRVSGEVLVDDYPYLLRLPDNLQTPRFRSWANALLADAGDDPLEVCRTVADRIRAAHRYQLAEPVGPYPHAIQNFLFGPERSGFCMHFASALAIALRQGGIPARIAVGLMGGEPDPRVPKDRQFRSAHAHAWVEIPIQLPNGDRDWAVFDATAAADLAGGGWPPSTPPAEMAGAAKTEFEGFQLTGFLNDNPDAVRLAGWFAALLGVACLIRLFGTRRSPRLRRAEDPKLRELIGYGTRLRKALQGAAGWQTERPTLEALQRRLIAESEQGHVEGDLQAIAAGIDAIQETRFGGRPLDDARKSRIEAGIKAGLALKQAPEPKD